MKENEHTTKGKKEKKISTKQNAKNSICGPLNFAYK